MRRFFQVCILIFSVVGCAHYPNVAKYEVDYYRKSLNDSDNIKELKEFLSKDKTVIAISSVIDNQNGGTFSKIYIGGQLRSFVNPYFNENQKINLSDLIFNALDSYYADPINIQSNQYIKDGKYYRLTLCADFTNSNLTFSYKGKRDLILPVTYIVTREIKEDLTDITVTPKILGCNDHKFSDVVYRNNIKVLSTLQNVKITYKYLIGAFSLNDIDEVNLLVIDALYKAALDILNDKKMLLAWKDYHTTLHSSSDTLEPPKNTVEEGAEINLKIDEAKKNCLELGFKVGTKNFGNCVLEIIK